MGKLIDADAFVDKFAHIPMVQDALRKAVDSMPTVDAVPVVHGRWIRVYSRPGVLKYLGWTCDQCGQRTGNEYAPQWYKFCPDCGARMDGKDGDHHE